MKSGPKENNSLHLTEPLPASTFLIESSRGQGYDQEVVWKLGSKTKTTHPFPKKRGELFLKRSNMSVRLRSEGLHRLKQTWNLKIGGL